VSSPAFYHCVIKDHPASRGRGPLSKAQFKNILALSTTQELKDRAKAAVEDLVKKHNAFGCPWIVAYKVPIDDRPLSLKEKRANPLEPYEWSTFYGVDRFEAMGYFLGPEYEWKGPFPDGIERFRPRASGPPGIPTEAVPFKVDIKSRL